MYNMQNFHFWLIFEVKLKWNLTCMLEFCQQMFISVSFECSVIVLLNQTVNNPFQLK